MFLCVYRGAAVLNATSYMKILYVQSYSSCIWRGMGGLEHYLCVLLMLRLLVNNGRKEDIKTNKQLSHKGLEWVLCWQQTNTGENQQSIKSLKAKQSLISWRSHSQWLLPAARYRFFFWERVFNFPSYWVLVSWKERWKLSFLWAFSSHLPSFLFSYLSRVPNLKYGIVNCKAKPLMFLQIFFTLPKTTDSESLQCCFL